MEHVTLTAITVTTKLIDDDHLIKSVQIIGRFGVRRFDKMYPIFSELHWLEQDENV